MQFRIYAVVAGVWISAWLAEGAVAFESPAAKPDYLRAIKPLLRSRCISCHGPIKQEADLRLDAASFFVSQDSDRVVQAGDAASSTLIDRVSSSDLEERMPPAGAALTEEEIAMLKEWIDAGAEFPPDEPITPAPRDHWAFQPVQPVALPTVRDSSWASNAIDLFVLAELERKDWTPSEQASPSALQRRTKLDVVGLPPSLSQQDSFAQSVQEIGFEEAYERWVAELLADPGYGERFARYWMDVVRYADSNGYERDATKPQVWRYRDYLIQAFNADLPFDRLILEQLASDELDDGQAETMVATTYLRLGPWDDEPADVAADRFDQLDDLVNTTSQAFLGLTMGCARCHDHKFDPLTQRDYYSLVSVFSPLHRPREQRVEHTLPIATLSERSKMTEEEIKAAPQGYFLMESSGPHRPDRVLTRGSPHAPAEEVGPAVPVALVRAPVEFRSPSEFSSQRRHSLARWIVDESNPLTARVIVNRVWQWHFGEGLVRTANDFGLNGERPSHPELLDYLAWWFVHEAKWSLKDLHKLILTSSTYRQAQADRQPCLTIDPDNRLLWKRSLQRLDVEAIRDSMLSVSGQLDRRFYGEQMFPWIPKEALESHADQAIWPKYDERSAARRTVYAFTKRSLIVPMLEVLDLCDTTRSSPKRATTTVPTQALTLFNNEFVLQQATHLAQRLRREAGDELHAQIERVWRLVFCRTIQETERETVLRFLAEVETELREEREAARATATDMPVSDPNATTSSLDRESELAAIREAAMIQLCRVLLNANEFVYCN